MAVCNIEGAIKFIEQVQKRIPENEYNSAAIAQLKGIVEKYQAFRNDVRNAAGYADKGAPLDIYMDLNELEDLTKPEPKLPKNVEQPVTFEELVEEAEAEVAPVEASTESVAETPADVVVTDTEGLIANNQRGVEVLKELFKLNRERALSLYNTATSFVVSQLKPRGGNFNRESNTLTLYGIGRDNETTAHELIHSLQGAMSISQLSEESMNFLFATTDEFTSYNVGIDEATYKDVFQKIKDKKVEGIDRVILEKVYLTSILKGDYKPEATEEQNLERFGREFTAIVGSSKDFRSSMYKDIAREKKVPFKMFIEDVLKAIKNVKKLIARILKDDPEELRDNPDYLSALKLLDEYLPNGLNAPEPEVKQPELEAPKATPSSTDSYLITGNLRTNPGQTAAINRMKSWFKDTKDQAFMLLGRGGTGKTTVINVLMKELGLKPSQVAFAAPTNKAKKVLAEANSKSEYGSSKHYTVAQLLNIKPSMDEEGNQVFQEDLFAPEKEFPEVLVVDEASMLHSANYDSLLEKARKARTRIIFMGDNAQLPPIGDKRAPVKSAVFTDLKENSVALTELMRQSEGSPIIDFTSGIIKAVNWAERKLEESLDNAEKVKQRLVTGVYDGEKLSKYDAETNEGLILTDDSFDTLLPSFISDYKSDPVKTKYIHFNNHTHQNTITRTNKIRKALYGEKADQEMFIPGEPLVLNGPYLETLGVPESLLDNGEEFTVVSSRVTKKRLNYAVGKRDITTLNPVEVYEIVATSNITGSEHTFNKPVGDKKQIDAIIKEEKENVISYGYKPGAAFRVKEALAIDLSHGYIINTHRSQGSTYRNVYMDLGNITAQYNSSGNDIIKSLYVAASRPSKKLIVVNNNQNSTIINPVTTVDKVPVSKAFKDVNNSEVNDIIRNIENCKGKGKL